MKTKFVGYDNLSDRFLNLENSYHLAWTGIAKIVCSIRCFPSGEEQVTSEKEMQEMKV